MPPAHPRTPYCRLPNSAHPRTRRRPSVCTRAAGARCPRTRCRAGTGPRGWPHLNTCRRGTPRTRCSACPGTRIRGPSPPRTRGTPRSARSSRPGSSRRHSGTRRRRPPRTAPTCSEAPRTQCTACTAPSRSPRRRTSHLSAADTRFSRLLFGHPGRRSLESLPHPLPARTLTSSFSFAFSSTPTLFQGTLTPSLVKVGGSQLGKGKEARSRFLQPPEALAGQEGFPDNPAGASKFLGKFSLRLPRPVGCSSMINE
uniref:Uncharacterized protein n=1 Tax=Macaca mulatta TaxID=9544 RepID=A0A5F7ZL37_MACMU